TGQLPAEAAGGAGDENGARGRGHERGRLILYGSSMLERIALHQTRLRTPGLGLDAKGAALGAKGLVLLPSIDRLVALLSVYTREHSLEDLMSSLAISI